MRIHGCFCLIKKIGLEPQRSSIHCLSSQSLPVLQSGKGAKEDACNRCSFQFLLADCQTAMEVRVALPADKVDSLLASANQCASTSSKQSASQCQPVPTVEPSAAAYLPT